MPRRDDDARRRRVRVRRRLHVRYRHAGRDDRAADHRSRDDRCPEVTKLHEFPKNTSHVTYHDGSLFVTSRTGYVVFRFDLATEEVEIIAGNGEPGDREGRGTESSFGSPNAIRVGPDGSLYMNHGDDVNSWPVTIRRLTHRP